MHARFSLSLLLGSALVLAACSQENATETAAPAAAPAAMPAVTATIGRKPAPPGAVVYVIAPMNLQTLPSPVRVVFGLQGAGVAPAGVDLPNTGHHHLLVDTTLTEFDQPIPADAQHIHFGLGQTETTLELPPGRHTLQLVLGDQLHVPHDPPLISDVVTIVVTP